MEIFETHPQGATHEAHGVLFVRSGSCKQCGVCEDGACSHWDAESKLCLIYEDREAFCEECGYTHHNCATFPIHPWVDVIKEGVCGYTFTPLNEEEAAKKESLDNAWQ